MILKDFNEVFSGNTQLIESMEKLGYAYDLKRSDLKKVIGSISEYDYDEILKYEKLSNNDLKSLIVNTNKAIKNKNKEILDYISQYIKFMTKTKGHSLKDLNLDLILNIAQKNKFSQFLILALIFVNISNDEELVYIANQVMEKYGMNYADAIYISFTVDQVYKSTNLFMRDQIKLLIQKNSNNEQMINALYLSVQSFMLTGEGRNTKFLSNMVNKIPNFWTDLKLSKVEPQIIALMEIFLKK